MKREYTSLKIKLEEPQDIVTTSPEVETDWIPFPTAKQVEDAGIQDPANSSNFLL